MNHQFNNSSAFYPGATRYGGASAIAKRREAARKAFFTVKEAPTTSSARSSNSVALNGVSNMVHSYTINTNDIIRREAAVPQLTSTAKRILSWIEENCPAQQQETQNLGKWKRNKYRFNPMSYRAPKSMPSKTWPQVASPPQLRLKSVEFSNPIKEVPPVPCQLNNFSTNKDLTPKNETQQATKTVSPLASKTPLEITTPTPVVSFNIWEKPTLPASLPLSLPSKPLPDVAPPTPIRFKSVEYRGPIKDVSPVVCRSKNFATPKDLAPKKETQQPTKTVSPLASKTPLEIATPSPVVSFNILEKPTAPLPSIQPKASPQVAAPPSPIRFKSVEFSTPIKELPPVPCQPKNFSTNKDLTPKNETQQATKTVSPLASKTPLEITTPTPVVSFNIWEKPTLPASLPLSLPSKPLPEVAPPTPIRFKPVEYCGPIKDVSPVSCEPKNFTTPKDLTPKKETQQPTKTVSPPADKTPLEITTPSPVVSFDVEMDMEVEPEPPRSLPSLPSLVAPPQAPQTPTPTQIPTPTQTQTPTPAPTPTLAPTPTIPIVASQPLFMPPPSFPTPTFMPSVVSQVPSLPNGSNPFQPTSSTRGRKILRPTRRLPR